MCVPSALFFRSLLLLLMLLLCVLLLLLCRRGGNTKVPSQYSKNKIHTRPRHWSYAASKSAWNLRLRIENCAKVLKGSRLGSQICTVRTLSCKRTLSLRDSNTDGCATPSPKWLSSMCVWRELLCVRALLSNMLERGRGKQREE